MDICFLPAWYYDITGTGAGIFFKEQAQAAQDYAKSASIFYPALGPQYLGKEEWQLQKEQQLPTFKYQGFGFPKRITPLLFWYNKKVRKAFTLFLANRQQQIPDLIHAHSLWAAYAALVIKERWNIPFVYTEHLGKWTQQEYELPAYQLKVLKLLKEEASLITAVSQQLAQKIDDFFQQTLTKVTPNLVNDELFFPLATSSNSTDTFSLIAIGDPWYTKGLDVLIEAVGKAQRKTTKRLLLTLVDKIPGKEQLFPIINKYQLEEQVKFTGQLDRQALAKLLQQQNALVSASRVESFGITMVEALACGIPVIATKTAGSVDILQPFCGSIVPQEDAEGLANGIITCIKNVHSYDKQRLTEYAKSTYGKAAFNHRWQQHYQAVLNK